LTAEIILVRGSALGIETINTPLYYELSTSIRSL
jgi:hypothetical protein